MKGIQRNVERELPEAEQFLICTANLQADNSPGRKLGNVFVVMLG